MAASQACLCASFNMLCIVVAVGLLFVPALANTKELQDKVFQTMRLVLNGSVEINNWPLQLDWIESSLAVEDEHQRLVNQLFDESVPIITAKYLLLDQRIEDLMMDGQDPNQIAISNKVIVVDHLVFLKMRKKLLFFANVTIIAKLAIFEDVYSLENCSLVAEHLKVSAKHVFSNTFFAKRLSFDSPQDMLCNLAVSNHLLFAPLRFKESVSRTRANQFLSTVIELNNMGGALNQQKFESNWFLFLNMTINDRWCNFTDNQMHGHYGSIKGVKIFSKNVLQLVYLEVPQSLKNFFGNNINVEIRVINLQKLFYQTYRITNHVAIANLTFIPHSHKLCNNGSQSVSMSLKNFKNYKNQSKTVSNYSLYWRVENVWLAIPVLLAQLMPSADFFGPQSKTSIHPYLQTEATKTYFEVEFRLNQYVTKLIKTHMTAEYNKMTLRQSELSQNNSSTLVKFLSLNPPPIHPIFQYRAQDVLASDTNDDFFKVDTINFYTTGFLNMQNKILVANTVNFYCGLATGDSLDLYNVSIIADTVTFKTFQCSRVTLQQVLIVATKVFFTTRRLNLVEPDIFINSHVLAESITFSDAVSGHFNGPMKQKLTVQYSVFIADSLEFLCYSFKLIGNFFSADTFVIKCKICTVLDNFVLAKHAIIENTFLEIGQTHRLVWAGNSLFLQRFSVRDVEVTLSGLTLAAEVVNISCFGTGFARSNVSILRRQVYLCHGTYPFTIGTTATFSSADVNLTLKILENRGFAHQDTTIPLIKCTYSVVNVSSGHSLYDTFSELMSFFKSQISQVACESVASHDGIFGSTLSVDFSKLVLSFLRLLNKIKTAVTSKEHTPETTPMPMTTQTSAANIDYDDYSDENVDIQESDEDGAEKLTDYSANIHELISIPKYFTASIRHQNIKTAVTSKENTPETTTTPITTQTPAANNDYDEESDELEYKQESDVDSSEELTDYIANSHEPISIRMYSTASVRHFVKLYPTKTSVPKKQGDSADDFTLKDRVLLLFTIIAIIFGAMLLLTTALLLQARRCNIYSKLNANSNQYETFPSR